MSLDQEDFERASSAYEELQVKYAAEVRALLDRNEKLQADYDALFKVSVNKRSMRNEGLARDVNKFKKEVEYLKQNISELEETREKLYKQIDFYRMTAKWHFEYISEKGLDKDQWNWKVVKGYVKPEGGLIHE